MTQFRHIIYHPFWRIPNFDFSANLVMALKPFGFKQKVYVDFCQMANNNVGAYWLSVKKEILNPYFGNDMLTCGEISQIIE